jgi:hypothetical protein
MTKPYTPPGRASAARQANVGTPASVITRRCGQHPGSRLLGRSRAGARNKFDGYCRGVMRRTIMGPICTDRLRNWALNLVFPKNQNRYC